LEHLHHFGLSQDPFSNESDLRLYFESPSHRDAQRRVERGLRQHKGLTLLTGEGGMGKTLLARRILDGLEEEIFEATLLVMLPGAADAMGIFQRFARQLGAEEPARDRAGVLGQIYEQLAIVREDGRHAVLIVDDAQVMSPQVFAELGGLLSLEYEDRRLMSMLFVGSPELDRQIQNDASLFPRVDVRVRIQPLDLQSSIAYLTHRLQVARARPDLIPPATMEVLCKLSRGRPRRLNTLADNALFETYLAGRMSMEPGDVERAAADLGIGLEGDPSGAHPRMTPASAAFVHRIDPAAAARGGSEGAPRGLAAATFDLGSELELTEALPESRWGAGVGPDLDLDLLGPEPVATTRVERHAKVSMEEEMARFAAPRQAPASIGSAGAPELDGLFVELIEE
jgi:type II secretory pathway predicted ATPase ExeA